MDDLSRKIAEAQHFILNQLGQLPPLAIVLGSGLGGFADRLENPNFISTADIPHYPRSTVAGHAGYWVMGTLHGKKVVAVKGRVHFYEGYSLEKVTFPVRLLGRLGIRYLVITNAAGSLNPLIRPGDLMLIDDHINLFLTNPLIGIGGKSESDRFVDMSAPYSEKLACIAEKAALDLRIELKKGVLIGSSGPTYETAAEVNMMRKLGGDAGTMSTIPEVIVANRLNLEVLGVSCITNMTTGLSGKKLDHREVTEVAALAADRFQKLMEETIVRILSVSV